MQVKSVLFVGRRNAARSIMAETCFNAAAIPGWRAFSAGWQTQSQIDALAIAALRSQGLPVDSLYSKPVDIFLQPGAPEIDHCVFLDRGLPENAAAYPGHKQYWRVTNPHDDANLQSYRDALGTVMFRISDLMLTGLLHEPHQDRIAS